MVDDVRNEQLMTRAQVIAEWDISLATFRRDDLSRVRHGGTGARYRRSDIEAWARKRGLAPRSSSTSLSGEDFAAMFDLLAEGVTPDQIVQRTRRHPDAVEAVIERRHKMMKAVVAMNEQDVAELLAAARVDARPPIRDAKHLIELVRAAHASRSTPAHVVAPEPADPEPFSTERASVPAPVAVTPPAPPVSEEPPAAAEMEVLHELRLVSGHWTPQELARIDRGKPDFGEWAVQQLTEAKAGRGSLSDARGRIRELGTELLRDPTKPAPRRNGSRG